ncbi:MAG: molybdopterin-dependent oxidoreductase [Gemmatimonadetes bacterium]|nr:molybdopterin-dependent oxidoreductase [Gemmatimonadota bacterium]
MSNPLVDMEKPDVIFCIGTNMTECHPVAATRLKRALARGARMIVADPRRIGLADLADLWLPIRVGSDTALLLAMAHVIAREGLVDRGFVEGRTREAEAFLEHVKDFTPEWAAPICEVPAADIERAALWYAQAERGAIYYTLGITEHICGVENVQSLCNLALMTGHIGREGTGVNPMRGQNNIQGAGDCGALPNNYAGFQSVTDPANQAKFERVYGRATDLEKGMTKVTALELAGDRIRAMLIDGENTVVSDPDRQHCQHALESLDCLVVIDIFMTETAELADVVFPASAWAETDGVCTNTERRVQRLRAAVPPPGEARPDWWIIDQLAQRMGFQGFGFASAKEVFNELCAVSPIYAGLDWDRIEHGEYQWPVPEPGHPGTPRLHEEDFPIEGGRGLFKLVRYRDPAETISSDYGSPPGDAWRPTIPAPRPDAQPASTTSCRRRCSRSIRMTWRPGASRTEAGPSSPAPAGASTSGSGPRTARHGARSSHPSASTTCR